MRHKTLTIMLTLLMNMAVSVVCADEHKYVDLGLPSGTLWATCNVGASSPEEYGDYFAWGETIGYNGGKTTYWWSNYKHCNGFSTSMTKYNYSSSNGTVDNKTELEPADDAAYVNWGPDWRMPSLAQFEELMNSSYTTAICTTQNGVYGCKITSKTNGNSIFLSAAGFRDAGSLYAAGSHGYYWSRTLYTSSRDPYYARRLNFYSAGIYPSDYYNRYDDHSVRPVRISKDEDNIEDVSMDNGQNEMGNGIYDLSGREVTKPKKGIYIKDGKKMIAK